MTRPSMKLAQALVLFAFVPLALGCGLQGEGQPCDRRAGNNGNDDCDQSLGLICTDSCRCCPKDGKSTVYACSHPEKACPSVAGTGGMSSSSTTGGTGGMGGGTGGTTTSTTTGGTGGMSGGTGGTSSTTTSGGTGGMGGSGGTGGKKP